MATKRELSTGMKDLQEVWNNKIEMHMDGIDRVSEPKGFLAAVSVVPHLLALFFTVFVIWVAKPATSKFILLIKGCIDSIE